MKGGYSKLLICDYSLPPVGATLHQAISDFAMMHFLSARDRTEQRWLNLLHSADFELVKIWKHPDSEDSIFEAELVF